MKRIPAVKVESEESVERQMSGQSATAGESRFSNRRLTISRAVRTHLYVLYGDTRANNILSHYSNGDGKRKNRHWGYCRG